MEESRRQELLEQTVQLKLALYSHLWYLFVLARCPATALNFKAFTDLHPQSYVNFRVNNVDETAQHDDKVEHVPGVSEIILGER